MAELIPTHFKTPAAFRAWLRKHHRTARALILRISKNHAAESGVTYAQALDEALCYGWIDGQKGALDDECWLQRFTPRKARSKWSRVNCARIGELIELGRMRPAGLAEIAKAKADGRWAVAYESQKTATVPPDLAAALEADPEAAKFFATLNSRNRYAILYRIADAKKPETRAARIEKYVAMCQENKLIYP